MAKSALTWVSEKSTDEGYAAIAKLRLAGLLIDEKAFDAALKLLEVAPPTEFVALFADRKGRCLCHSKQASRSQSRISKGVCSF